MCTQDLKAVVDGIEGIQISQGLGLGDFDLIRVIGRGSYAKVLLVRLKKNEQIYAMKVVKKELVHDDEVTDCCHGDDAWGWGCFSFITIMLHRFKLQFCRKKSLSNCKEIQKFKNICNQIVCYLFAVLPFVCVAKTWCLCFTSHRSVKIQKVYCSHL